MSGTLPPKSKATPARAREDADEGVNDCLKLMTTGQWVLGKSHIDIAHKHNVSPSTARDWATNASRMVRLCMSGDIEDIRATMLATLGVIINEAMNYQRIIERRDADALIVSQPDLKAAIAAIAEQAKLLGLVVQKHEVAMTPEEAKALVAEAAKLHEGS